MLETPRLLLRPFELTDEDDLFAYQSDPETVRYIPWPPRTRDAVRAALHAVVGRTRIEKPGDDLSLVIVEKQGGAVIGQVNLTLGSREDRHAELGFVVNRAFTGRGIATEASGRMLEFAFTERDLHRVTARIDTRNPASAAVAAKLGMRREAEFLEAEWFKGEWSSVWIYALLAAEWRAARCEAPHRRGDR